MSTTRSFHGIVGGVTYDDPALFETAARALGYRSGGAHTRVWKVGAALCVTLNDGTKVNGQVWAPTDKANYVWVALDDGTYVSVFTPGRTVYRTPNADTKLGKVAA